MPKKCPKFSCTDCDFVCSKQSNYDTHLSTRKHKILTNPNKKMPKNAAAFDEPTNVCEKSFQCGCGKKYKHASSLSTHKKKCVLLSNAVDECVFTKNVEGNSSNEMVVMDPSLKESSSIDVIKPNTDLVQHLIQQTTELKEQNMLLASANNDFKNFLMEQNKTILELASKVGNTTNYTTNHNKFNIKFFLNEQCKDAINMTDFVASLNLNVADLERVGQLGYAEGISRIFIRGLKEMDVFKRPIHCSDIKRETIYIRDQDKWTTDDEDRTKIKTAIRRVAHNNFKQITEWTANNPNHKKQDTPEYNQWVNIMHNSMGTEDKNDQKIIKNVLLATVIDK